MFEPLDPTGSPPDRPQLGDMNGGPRLRRLDQDDCIRLLAENTLGRVSVTMSALPAIRTVRYAMTPGHVVFRAAPHSRLRAAAANSIIAFHTDHAGETNGLGWSVLVQGLCQEVTRLDLIEQLRHLPLPAWSDTDDAFLRLALDRVTGEFVYWNQPDDTRRGLGEDANAITGCSNGPTDQANRDFRP